MNRKMEMNRIAVLREGVYTANLAIHAEGLAKLTWGHVSGYDPELGLVAIKPRGVDYSDLEPESIVFLDPDGRIRGDVPRARASGSSFRPRADTPSHLELYRSFPSVRGIVHTHYALDIRSSLGSGLYGYTDFWNDSCRSDNQ